MELKSKRFPGFTDIIGILVTFFAGVISFYAQSRDPQTGIILFLALLGAIILYFIISYPISIYKEKVNQINRNTEDIKKIKEHLNIINDKLNFRRDIEEVNLKISKLEGLLNIKGKRGATDPRWIVIIIILILLYLFLRSKGLI